MALIDRLAEVRAYNYFRKQGMTVAGAIGAIANLEAESDGFYPDRVEYLCLNRLKAAGKNYTKETYTAAVDSGKISYDEFLHPLPGKQYGYGFAQWTSPGRKEILYKWSKERRVSIADENLQLEYLIWELKYKYQHVWKVLTKATSIKTASDYFLVHFEIPANTSETVRKGRADRGYAFEKYLKCVNGEGEGSMAVNKKIEKTARWMENTAKDDSHGYDQDNRWGPDYDCSSAIFEALEESGIPAKTYSFKTYGCAYTGVMPEVLEHFGFENIINKVNIKTGAGLERGDILLNKAYHTAMYIGNGMEVEASINERGTAHGGKTGDQTGKEFLIRSYRNYPWTHIYRYKGDGSLSGTSEAEKGYLSKGDTGSAVKTMQAMLIAVGYPCGSSGADGDFGANTEKALRNYQKDHKLESDGCYGAKSKASLEALYKKAQAAISQPAITATTEAAQCFDNAKAGTYKVATDLWMKYGAGKEKNGILVVPKDGKVQCYGYYNNAVDGTPWLYVVYNGKAGFCSSKYLKKSK